MGVRTQEDERTAISGRHTAAERVETREPVEPRREPVPAPEPVVDRGPRPRTSLFSTLALITGVAAALFVLTGALAGYGVVLGGLALIFALAGISATSRRHVAGRSDAIIGLALALGAVVLGVLVLNDSLSWLTTTSDKVGEFRDWLDRQTIDRF
jgi:hypothetical protein